jgi:predicted glycosyltransferase involved in capsule biosynthesis
MKKLTIVASNRNRFDPFNNSTIWFIKSLQRQTCMDFELVIVDGGSRNIDEIKDFCKRAKFDMRVVDFKLGKKFERARLNNAGIRNAKYPYIMTTDVDMFFAKEFVATLIKHLEPHVFIESRTMYWKPPIANAIYSGEIDPFEDLEAVKVGRIKKRTTAGGCQCAHIKQWEKVRGFDETMIQWGSEDYDLYLRISHVTSETIWMGERRESIMVFHQPHYKSKEQVLDDLKHQNENKKTLILSRQNPSRHVNRNQWGGLP